MIREIQTNGCNTSIFDNGGKVVTIMQDRDNSKGETDRNVVIVNIDDIDKVIRAMLHIRDSVLYKEVR